jgi:hypothetical protein
MIIYKYLTNSCWDLYPFISSNHLDGLVCLIRHLRGAKIDPPTGKHDEKLGP